MDAVGERIPPIQQHRLLSSIQISSSISDLLAFPESGKTNSLGILTLVANMDHVLRLTTVSGGSFRLTSLRANSILLPTRIA